MYYYMEYCHLPAVKDYWRPVNDINGGHPVMTARGMAYHKFVFLFRHIYVVPVKVGKSTDSDDGDSSCEDDNGYMYIHI